MQYLYAIALIIASCHLGVTQAQYEDDRCLCTCTITKGDGGGVKRIHVSRVPPNNDCDSIPAIAFMDAINAPNSSKELCPQCKCKYEARNSMIVRVAVGIVIGVISVLVIYMFFLLCLEPLLNKQAKSNYVEHTNEEDDTIAVGPGVVPGTSHQMGIRGNVLDRVGHQQDKWKRQVREQRRNIYDRHTMLN